MSLLRSPLGGPSVSSGSGPPTASGSPPPPSLGPVVRFLGDSLVPVGGRRDSESEDLPPLRQRAGVGPKKDVPVRGRPNVERQLRASRGHRGHLVTSSGGRGTDTRVSGSRHRPTTSTFTYLVGAPIFLGRSLRNDFCGTRSKRGSPKTSGARNFVRGDTLSEGGGVFRTPPGKGSVRGPRAG